MKELDKDRLKRIYANQLNRGCFLEWDEWEEKVRKAYAELVKVAKRESLITYGELGMSKLNISLEWLQAKIGWIVGACSEYELEDGNPLLSSLAVNADTFRPSTGYWGFSTMPSRLHANNWEDRHKSPPESIVEERETFWASEVKAVYESWDSRDF